MRSFSALPAAPASTHARATFVLFPLLRSFPPSCSSLAASPSGLNSAARSLVRRIAVLSHLPVDITAALPSLQVPRDIIPITCAMETKRGTKFAHSGCAESDHRVKTAASSRTGSSPSVCHALFTIASRNVRGRNINERGTDTSAQFASC